MGIDSTENSGTEILYLQQLEIKFQRNKNSCSITYSVQTSLPHLLPCYLTSTSYPQKSLTVGSICYFQNFCQKSIFVSISL